MSNQQPFLTEAAELLGPRGFTRDAELMKPWLTDWHRRFTGAALAMASPASTAEVSALVELCARHGIAIVPQGGNSSMSGGATPDSSGNAIVLSLRRMHAIRSVEAQARQAVCDAGVNLFLLQVAVE